MIARSAVFEEFYTPNIWVPFGAAMAFHLALLMWDPTILKASPYTMQSPLIKVTVMDHLPLMEPAVPKPLPKKSRRSGLATKAKARHTAALHPARKAPAHKTFMSKITIPKFVPTEIDEPIAASPLPGAAPAAKFQKVTPVFAPGPKLNGKSRGVRVGDVHFQFSDRGSIAAGGPVVAIPIGEERGDSPALPSSAAMHEAPGIKTSNYHYTPGASTGELAGKNKAGYYGVVAATTYVEGSLRGSSPQAEKVVTGKGFSIGGPVGDRKILNRRLPEYPAWAEEKGVTALIRIYFTVKPDGTLRTNVRILSSSGYTELDDLAKEALRQWRFAPRPGGATADTAWGIITFRFTLS